MSQLKRRIHIKSVASLPIDVDLQATLQPGQEMMHLGGSDTQGGKGLRINESAGSNSIPDMQVALDFFQGGFSH